MRLWRLAPVPAVVLALALPAAAAGSRHADLRITYWPHGTEHAAKSWRLTCSPAGGTHPHPGLACRELASHADELGPVTRPCPLHVIRGAPQASVHGRVGGKSIDRVLQPACDSAAFRDLRTLLTGRA